MTNENPFGSPDGASQDPGTFIRFSNAGVWRDLAFQDRDRRVRIFVGRRGSGKSRYLRKMQLSVQDEGLLDYLQRDTAITLTNLHWMHKAFSDRAERLEMWQDLWSCAVYGGVASFLFNTELGSESKSSLTDRDRYFIEKEVRNFIPEGPREQPIVGVLNNILSTYNDRSRLVEFVKDPKWFSIESIVLDVIKDSTPLFAFIDALDDNYGDAPAESTDAQVGLLIWILKKVVDASVKNRLHIVVTVRDVIYSSLLETDNGQRYNDKQYIRCLDWDDRSSYFYLQEKIRLLPVRYLVLKHEADDPLERWLGFKELVNERRNGNVENVKDYILRHTRFLPRELNEIGNAISRNIWAANSSGIEIGPVQIRTIISTAAKEIARRIINEVVLHMAAIDGVPEDSRHHENYTKEVRAAVLDFIKSLGEERFGLAKLNVALEQFSKRTPWWSAIVGGNKIGIQDILWQHALVGYQGTSDPEGWSRFFHSSGGGTGDLTALLPTSEFYYLHSSLIDILPLKTTPNPPIAHGD